MVKFDWCSSPTDFCVWEHDLREGVTVQCRYCVFDKHNMKQKKARVDGRYYWCLVCSKENCWRKDEQFTCFSKAKHIPDIVDSEGVTDKVCLIDSYKRVIFSGKTMGRVCNSCVYRCPPNGYDVCGGTCTRCEVEGGCDGCMLKMGGVVIMLHFTKRVGRNLPVENSEDAV